uniref:LPS-binding protein n=1 Tax=Suberites domuncula TaxID=55567 RepID=Q4W1E6_SUBDO|nr:LPS-binding protein [Suberites domuncula]
MLVEGFVWLIPITNETLTCGLVTPFLNGGRLLRGTTGSEASGSLRQLQVCDALRCSGTAGELDYTPIRSSNLDVFGTLSQNQRRACFDVRITSDNVFENDETFSLRLDFDELVPQATRDSVTIEPSVVYVTIQNDDTLPPTTQAPTTRPPTTQAPTTRPPTTTTPGPDVPYVNDTVIGDPLFTVPLTNANFSEIDMNIEGQPSLCFEIHGEANQYFNLVTDNCVSVNARYSALTDFLNVINRIGVRAVDDMGQCRNVSVDLEGCSASVDGAVLTSNYRLAGIFIRPYRNHVRVSVPNCNGLTHLVMYVLCQQNVTLRDPLDGELFTASMIKYVITHGVNLNENSHGLLGQFWNVPIEVSEYIDSDLEGDHYELAVTHPDFSGTRRFVGHLLGHSWEEKTPCFYVGNVQGGPIYEVEDPNDSVIEGKYKDYRMDGAFDTSFMYSRFDDSQCV